LKKTSLAIVVCLAILWLTPAPAEAQVSFNFTIGQGAQESITYDPYLQYTFEPWLSDESYELRPFVTGGLTVWVDKDFSDSVWGLVAAFGLKLSYNGDSWRPFFSLSGGPSYISQDYFVWRDLGGGHYLFNSRAILGLDFGQDHQHSLGVHATHYSNGRTQRSNDGFNSWGLSYGYSF
jgi:lipid A 3-O-deacylase